ncbi:MAG: cytochrome c3 family protein, partial [Allosphingosinicella sp.]
MTFVLRLVSHSADGREIVRTARVEGDRLTLGRDPASQVHLTDLAVALHHAVVERVSPSRLTVSAEPGLYVEINGSKTSRGGIELAGGGSIRIASHVLEFIPMAPDSDEVAVTVARAGVGEEELERADVRRFTVASAMPGKRPLAWLLVAAILAVFLAWPIWSFYQKKQNEAEYAQAFHPDRMWLSGSLSQGHASLQQNCQACHVQPFVSVRDESCKACHTGIDDHGDHSRLARARPGLGRWDRLQLRVQETFGLTPGRCVDCHTEHEGPQEIPPTPQRFCADCHQDIQSRLRDSRLGSASDFARDHPEFQPSVLIRWDGETPRMQRVPLNRRPQEMSNLKFPHALHLAPSGGVAQMARRLAATNGFGAQLQCADCHVPTPDGTRFQPVQMEEDCAMCHSLAFDRIDGTIRTLRHGSPQQVVADLRAFYRQGGPQRPAELGSTRDRPGTVTLIREAIQRARARAGAGARADRAIRGVFSRGGACYDCHIVESASPGSAGFRIRPVAFPTRYLLHGWFDHRAHQIVEQPGHPRAEGSGACLTCHRADRSSASTDLLVPDLASCRTCHGGERTSAPVASSCAMCHDYHMDE